jgi:hypothetical protein
LFLRSAVIDRRYSAGNCFGRVPEIYARKQFFSLLSRALVARRLPRNELGEDWLNKNTEERYVNVVRSVWRRLKRDLKEAIIRDLQPVKDVKGGGGVKRESKPTRGGPGTRPGR